MVAALQAAFEKSGSHFCSLKRKKGEVAGDMSPVGHVQIPKVHHFLVRKILLLRMVAFGLAI